MVEAVDQARLNERPLPLVFIDGRRDCEPLDGTTLDVRLDTRIEDVDWPVVATIPGDRVKMIEASDPSRPGGLGLNKNLVYHTAGAASQTFSAKHIEMGLEGRDGELNDLLISEWRWLPPIDPTLAGEESTSMMVFAGYVSDLRTGHRGRLMAFRSYANQLSYFVIPFEGARDPFPRLEIPECHAEAHRDISLSEPCELSELGVGRIGAACDGRGPAVQEAGAGEDQSGDQPNLSPREGSPAKHHRRRAERSTCRLSPGRRVGPWGSGKDAHNPNGARGHARSP